VSLCLQYERKSRRNGEQQRQQQQQNDQQPKGKKTTYSKRRFVNIEGAGERSNRHLYTMPSDVYGTSDRVGQLLVVAGFSQAVEFLIHLPLDLQSTVAWNQLLGYCAKSGKSNEAETLFTQVMQ
jgi:pentatricopeptide repeat protein